MYDVPYIDRTLPTWHTIPISPMKQNMHILINASQESLPVHFDNFTDNYTSKP